MRISDWSSDVCSSDLSQLLPHGLHCYLVDDGSHAACAAELDRLAAAQSDWLQLIRLPHNQGKGAAVMAGFAAAATDRSEEHTSELQSLMRISYAVFCLKKQHITTEYTPLTFTNTTIST